MTELDFCTLLRCKPKHLQARISGMGHGSVCTRCGGCGRYSFNGEHSRCYKCNGAGTQPVPLTSALYRILQADVASGKLDTYLVNLRCRQSIENTAKSAVQRTMYAWENSGVSKAYDWRKAADHIEPHRTIADTINLPMYNAFHRVQSVANHLDNLNFRLNHSRTRPTADEVISLKSEIASTIELLIKTADAAIAEINSLAAMLKGTPQ